MKDIIVEVCAGNIEDCINAEKAGANRIELVTATYLGGLTPSLGLIKQSLKKVNIPIIAMLRPRGGGFHYSKEEIEMMFLDAQIMLEAGVHGIAFGFLNSDYSIDVENTRKMVELIKKYNAEAVFHRAFDLTKDGFKSIETLIDLNVDRILTSGRRKNVNEGMSNMKVLYEKYSDQIEFCAGSGVNKDNALKIINDTKITQLHATFKSWGSDPTTTNDFLTYKYSDDGDFEYSDINKIKEFVQIVNKG